MNVVKMVRNLQDDPREPILISTTAAMMEAALLPLSPATKTQLATLARRVLGLVDTTNPQ